MSGPLGPITIELAMPLAAAYMARDHQMELPEALGEALISLSVLDRKLDGGKPVVLLKVAGRRVTVRHDEKQGKLVIDTGPVPQDWGG